MTRIARAWDALSRDQRLAAISALALLLAMFLPWYQQNAVDRSGVVSSELNAFAVFSFAEAVILLTGLAVLLMLFARAEQRALPFPLPGSDGAVVMAAGIWSSLLLVLRLFDKPGVSTSGVANVGVEWGIFLALGAAGALAYAGSRMRAAGDAHGPQSSGAGSRRPPREQLRRSRRETRRPSRSTPPWLEVPPWIPAEESMSAAEPDSPAARGGDAPRAPRARRRAPDASGGRGGARQPSGRPSAGRPQTRAGRRTRGPDRDAPAHEQLSFDEREEGAAEEKRHPD